LFPFTPAFVCNSVVELCHWWATDPPVSG